MGQWFGFCALTAVCPGSIPGQRTKILDAAQHGQLIKIIIINDHMAHKFSELF